MADQIIPGQPQQPTGLPPIRVLSGEDLLGIVADDAPSLGSAVAPPPPPATLGDILDTPAPEQPAPEVVEDVPSRDRELGLPPIKVLSGESLTGRIARPPAATPERTTFIGDSQTQGLSPHIKRDPAFKGSAVKHTPGGGYRALINLAKKQRPKSGDRFIFSSFGGNEASGDY